MSKPQQRNLKIRLPIRVTVVTIFILATVLTATLAVGLQYHFGRHLAAEAAVQRFRGLADSTGQYLNAVDQRAAQTASVLASYPGLTKGHWVDSNVRDVFAAMMRNAPMLYAIYIGFDNGDFYELVNLDSGAAVRKKLKADPADRWVIITIRDTDTARTRSYDFYSADFHLRESRSEITDYDARTRPWFVQAIDGKVNKTAPYLFSNLRAPGQTYSTRIQGGVIAVDIALSSMSEYLSTRKADEFGQVFLYRNTGETIASNLRSEQRQFAPSVPALKLSDSERALIASHSPLSVSNEMDWAPIDFSISGDPRGYSIDYLSLISRMTGLQFEFVNGFAWPKLTELYKSGDIDVLQPIYDNGQHAFSGTFTDPFLDLPYSLVTRPGKKNIKHLSQMKGSTIAIPKGWSIIPVLRQHYPDITITAVKSTRAVFEAVADGRADAGLDVGEILHYTGDKFFFKNMQYHNNIDFSPVKFPTQLHFLLSPKNAELIPIFNRAIAQVSSAQKSALARKWFHGMYQSQGMLAVPYSELLDYANDEQLQQKLVKVTINGTSNYVFVTRIGEAGSTDEFFGIVIPVSRVIQPAHEKVKLSILFTVLFLLLLIPAPWIFASPIVAPIKKLALENEKIRERKYEALDIPESYIREIDELGRSMSTMVAAIRQHEANQEALMDSFIQLIAQAIDDKSHYTAAHCERVPELAFMLAEQAELSKTPPFHNFAFASSEEWREFKVAAWLHDCGKITTPEHIVDKGSKLETIYNRIHEVRTRFEVLWRDAEISYWRQRVADPSAEFRLKLELSAAQEQLKEDFQFVAAMNIGGEYLSEEKKEKLKKIATRTWTRHFSDRLGLSPLEETRLQGEETPLPCSEMLLADKPEHIVEREHSTEYDSRLGINMDIPKNLYNRGELYNLCIERGTLTAEDRFKINEHIIATIRMLDALPFPEELARVPRYASTHHETMKGSGYPRRLSRDDLSIPERIMVLADIFEALTAADRPYKKAKLVSEAVDILAKMVADDHVDRDVFELFLSSGVYLKYARRFLPETQIDEVNIESYLSGRPPRES